MEIRKELECKSAKVGRLREEVAYLRRCHLEGSMTDGQVQTGIDNIRRKIELFRKLDLI